MSLTHYIPCIKHATSTLFSFSDKVVSKTGLTNLSWSFSYSAEQSGLGIKLISQDIDSSLVVLKAFTRMVVLIVSFAVSSIEESSFVSFSGTYTELCGN